MKSSEEVMVDILEKMANDPLAAAAEFEKVGNDMLAIAKKLRESYHEQQANQNPSGLEDRVKVALLGPDNTLKQYVDTANQS